jgi:hypothetical protein
LLGKKIEELADVIRLLENLLTKSFGANILKNVTVFLQTIQFTIRAEILLQNMLKLIFKNTVNEYDLTLVRCNN